MKCSSLAAFAIRLSAPTTPTATPFKSENEDQHPLWLCGLMAFVCGKPFLSWPKREPVGQQSPVNWRNIAIALIVVAMIAPRQRHLTCAVSRVIGVSHGRGQIRESLLRSLSPVVTDRAFCSNDKRPIASPPIGDGPKTPSTLLANRSRLLNHNPFFRIKGNSLRQV